MQHTTCNLKRAVLQNALGVALGCTSLNASALLTSTTVLAFDPGNSINPGYTGSPPGYSPGEAGDSWFSIKANPVVTLYWGLQPGQDGGLQIGVTQDTNGHASHPGVDSLGLPLHSGVGGIDDEWGFYYNVGLHFTTVPVTVVSDFGATKTLDLSGWNMTWNGIPAQPLGGGIQDCGTSTDGVCVRDSGYPDIAGTYDNGTGLATITCANASCSNSSTFTLDYAAVFEQGDITGAGGALYGLHLEGVISGTAVPVPAAAWLFGSGLLGLIGIAKKRKAT